MKLENALHMLKSYCRMSHKLTDNSGRPKLDQAVELVLKELENKDKKINELQNRVDAFQRDYSDNVEEAKHYITQRIQEYLTKDKCNTEHDCKQIAEYIYEEGEDSESN